MIWIFPMAGKGSRTQQLGSFKPFVDINGRKMLGWLFVSIRSKIHPDDLLVFTTTDEYADEFDVQQQIYQSLQDLDLSNDFELVTCPDTPRGPSKSVYLARDLINVDQPVISVNCDQFIDFDCLEYTSERQGFLPIYANFSQKSSYVRIQNSRITRIVEKQNISNLASAGVYGVACGKALLWALEKQFELEQLTNNEFYVGPALNNLIEEGFEFFPTLVRVKYDLGNVKGIEQFQDTAIGVLNAEV